MTRILIVEDEMIVAEDIQKGLEKSESVYDISIVSSGENALLRIREEPADLILMDIALKGELDGIEAAAQINSLYDIPVVFLTAHADEKTLSQAKRVEPYGYIVKPFEYRELHAVVEMALYKHEMEKKVKESKKWLERKVEERSKRIEILLATRHSIQKEKSWEKGLIIIAESVAKLGIEQCSIFLVNPLKETLDFHFGEGVNLSKDVSLSLRDTEYFGVQCVVEKRTVHIKEYSSQEGKQIIKSHSLVWIPIIVQNEAFAALAASNSGEPPITDEDVKDLEILAGMCGAFIDRTRILREPIPEEMLKTEITHWLDPSDGYIVLEKEPEKSFEIFCDLVTHSIPGFVVSREHPEKLKRKYRLVKTPVLWLSQFETETTIRPDSFSKLTYIIGDFIRKSEESVILLDGVEYLVAQINFETVLTYLQELKDIVVMNNSRLIIPLHKEIFSPREYGKLEKEFKVL
jgi:CheY-like chemotaxis protein